MTVVLFDRLQAVWVCSDHNIDAVIINQGVSNLLLSVSRFVCSFSSEMAGSDDDRSAFIS